MATKRLPLRLSDVATLLGYCVLFAAVAPVVALLGLRAWVSGGALPSALRGLAAVVGGVDALTAAGFGGFVGLLALHWLDDMKRYSALVLSVATGAALALFASLDVFFRYLTPASAGAFVTGAVLAATLAGGTRIVYDDSPWQFPRASAGLFGVVGAVSVTSYLQVYAAGGVDAGATYTSELPLSAVWAGATTPLVDAGASLALIGTAFGLVTYEAREEFLVLGPARSGKTTLQAGFYHVVDALDDGQTKPNPSAPLADQYRGFLAADGWGPLDDPTPNLEYNLLRFRYQEGGSFAKYRTVRAFDTAGEHFGWRFEKHFKEAVPTTVFSLAFLRYLRAALARPFLARPETGSVDSHAEMSDLLSMELLLSDTAVFVIDAASLVDERDGDEQAPLSEYIGTYETILTALEQSVLPEKEVHIVVTKADRLRPLYAEYGTGPAPTGSYESFRTFVEYLLRERDDVFPAVNGLFRMAPEAEVHPVHFEIDDEASEEAGKPVPSEPVSVHGFEETLAALNG
jgi:hypothetical protein